MSLGVTSIQKAQQNCVLNRQKTFLVIKIHIYAYDNVIFALYNHHLGDWKHSLILNQCNCDQRMCKQKFNFLISQPKHILWSLERPSH